MPSGSNTPPELACAERKQVILCTVLRDALALYFALWFPKLLQLQLNALLSIPGASIHLPGARSMMPAPSTQRTTIHGSCSSCHFDGCSHVLLR